VLPATSRLAAVLAAAVVALAACGGGGDDRPATAARPAASATIALDFTPNAVHAPIYAAVREGLDRRHGVRLRIREPGSSPNSLGLLTSGRVDVGILDIHDLALARQRGIDVVGVAALVRRPLAALVARPSIRRPRDLEGHDVGVSGLPSDPAFLDAIIAHDGGDLARVHQVTIGFNAVSAIIAGKIDAAPVFWNAEGVALRRHGVPIREFRVEDYGAPPYPEVLLVTSGRTLRREPDRIQRTLLAIRDGIRTVEKDPDAAVRQIAHEAQTRDIGLIAAQLRAVGPIFADDLRLDRRVLEQWADFDARIGIVKQRPDVGRTFSFGLAG